MPIKACDTSGGAGLEMTPDEKNEPGGRRKWKLKINDVFVGGATRNCNGAQ